MGGICSVCGCDTDNSNASTPKSRINTQQKSPTAGSNVVYQRVPEVDDEEDVTNTSTHTAYTAHTAHTAHTHSENTVVADISQMNPERLMDASSAVAAIDRKQSGDSIHSSHSHHSHHSNMSTSSSYIGIGTYDVHKHRENDNFTIIISEAVEDALRMTTGTDTDTDTHTHTSEQNDNNNHDGHDGHDGNPGNNSHHNSEQAIQWKKVADFSSLLPIEVKKKLWKGVFKETANSRINKIPEVKRISKVLRTFVMLHLTRVYKKDGKQVPNAIKRDLPAIVKNPSKFIANFLKRDENIIDQTLENIYETLCDQCKKNMSITTKTDGKAKYMKKLSLIKDNYIQLRQSVLQNEFNKEDFLKNAFLQYMLYAYQFKLDAKKSK